MLKVSALRAAEPPQNLPAYWLIAGLVCGRGASLSVACLGAQGSDVGLQGSGCRGLLLQGRILRAQLLQRRLLLLILQLHIPQIRNLQPQKRDSFKQLGQTTHSPDAGADSKHCGEGKIPSPMSPIWQVPMWCRQRWKRTAGVVCPNATQREAVQQLPRSARGKLPAAHSCSQLYA